jgi:hypothetical protein
VGLRETREKKGKKETTATEVTVHVTNGNTFFFFYRQKELPQKKKKKIPHLGGAHHLFLPSPFFLSNLLSSASKPE